MRILALPLFLIGKLLRGFATIVRKIFGFGPSEEQIREMARRAEQGDVEAQFALGAMYNYGKGVPKDYQLAVKWYKLAAEQGDAESQNLLGLMYDLGNGVPQDYQLAIKWFRRAAEQGFADAQFNLGVMYDLGDGVPQDDQEAVKWYRLAANQGQAKSQYNLGVMYAEGKGVPQDYVLAYKWVNLAAAKGNIKQWAVKDETRVGDVGRVDIPKPAKPAKVRDFLATQMTQIQFQEAQKLAREFKPKKETP